ncbi:hypothetical protein B9Z19DRAFT_970819 [Tuber borchii]|uniref:Uncharacterized protein n=1 Tax=Tuber borchii TaxID=42251 RepID=A0A2T7A1Y5_TUBBO|nr:hypothetical protein B9Z19DRAFT_970819 [Tuber borchii]
MCRRTTCAKCSGVTWAGCGAHIPNVMDRVPKKQWCTCEGWEGGYPPGKGWCVIT